MNQNREYIVENYIKNHNEVKLEKLTEDIQKPVIYDKEPYIILQPGREHKTLEKNINLNDYNSYIETDSITLTVIEDKEREIKVREDNYGDQDNLYFITESALHFISYISTGIREFLHKFEIITPEKIKEHIQEKSGNDEVKIENKSLDSIRADENDMIINYTSSEQSISEILEGYKVWGSVKKPNTIPDYISIYVKDVGSVKYLCSVDDIINSQKFAESNDIDFSEYKWFEDDKIFYKLDNIYKINGPEYPQNRDFRSVSGALAGYSYTNIGKLKNSDNIVDFLDIECDLSAFYEKKESEEIQNISLFLRFLRQNYLISSEVEEILKNKKDIIKNKDPVVLSSSVDDLSIEIAEYICRRVQSNTEFSRYLFWKELSSYSNVIEYNHKKEELVFQDSEIQAYEEYIRFLEDYGIIDEDRSPIEIQKGKVYKYDQNDWVINNKIKKYPIKDVLNSLTEENHLLEDFSRIFTYKRKIKLILMEVQYVDDEIGVDPSVNIITNILLDRYKKFIKSMHKPHKFIDCNIDGSINTQSKNVNKLMENLKEIYYNIGIPENEKQIEKYSDVSFEEYKQNIGEYDKLKQIMDRYLNIKNENLDEDIYIGNELNYKGLIRDNLVDQNYNLDEIAFIFDLIIYDNKDYETVRNEIDLNTDESLKDKYSIELDQQGDYVIPKYMKKFSKDIFRIFIDKKYEIDETDKLFELLEDYGYLYNKDDIVTKKYKFRKEDKSISYIVDELYNESNIVQKGDILDILGLSTVYGEFALQNINHNSIKYESSDSSIKINIGDKYRIYFNKDKIDDFQNLDDCLEKFKNILINYSCLENLSSNSNLKIGHNFQTYKSENETISYVIVHKGEIYSIVDMTDINNIELKNIISHTDKRRCIFLINKKTNVSDKAKIFIDNIQYYELSWPTNIEQTILENIELRDE